MMPLMFASVGEENTIKKVGGSPEVKKHLENLGFVPGGNVTIISMLGGNVIVNVKEARVAISEEMARKIMVWFYQTLNFKGGNSSEHIEKCKNRWYCCC